MASERPSTASPTVAAVIAVYNRPALVVEALESVAAQTHRPDRLLVVDDGSTDDTAARVEAWMGAGTGGGAGTGAGGGGGAGCPQVLLRRPHGGTSAARNAAVDAAGDCELIAFLDSDDLWPPDYLGRMIEALAGNPGAVAASADVRRTDARTGRSDYVSAARFQGQATPTIFKDGCPVPSCTVVRRSAYLRAGGCDTALTRRIDEDLFLRTSLLGSWLHVPGEPVTLRCFAHLGTGGQPQIVEGQFSPDHVETIAMVRDRFYRRLGGHAVIPVGDYRDIVGGTWRTLGRRYAALGRDADASRCFRLALAANPRDLRPLGRLICAALADGVSAPIAGPRSKAIHFAHNPPDALAIAAVIPVYNRPVLVLEALRSLGAQSRPPFLTIVVDDGSTDDTPGNVERWMAAAAPGMKVRLIRQANAGVAAARNRAAAQAAAAGADCLAFLDSDDAWPPDYLERMAQTLATHPDAVVASADTCLQRESPTREQFLSAARLAGPATPVLFDRCCPSPSATVVCTGAFQACGGFDEGYRYVEDLELFLRLSLRGPWAYTPGAPVRCCYGAQAREPASPHLSSHVGTPEYIAAHIRLLGRFLNDYGGEKAVPILRRRRHLAELWHSLGKLRLQAGERAEARACFRHAVAEYPFYYRSLARVLRTQG